jgi:integrase
MVERLELCFKRLKEPPSVNAISIQLLLNAIATYPIEESSCHFSLKKSMRASVISATKYLVLIGLRGEADLDKLAKIKITRKVAPVRKFSNYETIERMLEENERMRMGRTNYETERIVVAIKLACYMGMRASEAIGLQWADIDIDKRKLSFIGKGERRESLFTTDNFKQT